MSEDLLPDYAELHCLSAFSFQRGASTAQELFVRAHELGYRALAITDEGSLAGIVRALEASRVTGVKLIVGSEVHIEGGPKLVLLVQDITGYRALCRMLTAARMRAPKGEYRLQREDVVQTEGLLALWVPGDTVETGHARWLKAEFPGRLWMAVELHRGPDDAQRLATLQAAGERLGLPLVAAGDAHMHVRQRRPLQDVMTAIRHKTTVAEAGYRLFPNGERHLRTRKALKGVYPADLLAESVAIANRCTFELSTEALGYTYPEELVPAGQTPMSWLRHLTAEGIRWRWPEGPHPEIRATIEKELALIEKKKYASFFLTVHDVVQYARSQGILCQGRGSAANSVVCFVLGVTSVNPEEIKLLFGRFLSQERNEPPDIDVDFEHERREEVLQYVFNKYGRDRAALATVAIQYRGRSAVRDVARALGVSPELTQELASTMERWGGMPADAYLRERGFDPDTPLMRAVMQLAGQLIGFPRHLSQHPGGFVISQNPLSGIVPTENASMKDRTVIQWDKDDLETLGLLKVDCLALGMLTAIQKTFGLLRNSDRGDHTLADIVDGHRNDKETYDMICKADTIGVFQIESRAQMAMLPRLRPREFYDLVVEVAIVRPGPIQGDMVHPYLRRRQGLEPVEYPSETLRSVLHKTLGVPLFQEHVMQIAVLAADYTEGEADQLRRSMAAWRRNGTLETHRIKLISGMLKNGYTQDFAERLFNQIQGFGDYGFPESHAASFALLAFVSSWLKCHEPAAFACGLINSAPMGFYSPDQLLQDARRHGVRVRPVDVRYSDWDCSLEDVADPQPAIRMGLRLVNGFSEKAALALMEARKQGEFVDVADLARRAQLDARHRGLLADAGALRALAGHRHNARWAVAGVEPQRPLFGDIDEGPQQAQVHLPMPTVDEDMRADYALVGTTLGPHPLKLLRARLNRLRYRSSKELCDLPHGRLVRTAGLVTLRQRPGTASGVIFMTLEDEHGMTNIVVWNHVQERQRRVLLESQLMAVEGRLETESGTRHVVAHRLLDLRQMLGRLSTHSRDFQ